MKRSIRAIVSALLACALLLSTAVPAFAETEYLAYGAAEEIRTSGCDEEYIVLRTPSDEPCAMYVEGVCASDTKMILIRAANEADGTVMRVFVRPEADGTFAVRIDTSEGSYDFPTATAGTVVKDEKGGQTNSRCYGTIPGYRPNPAMNGIYRVTVSRAVTEEMADCVYDGGWSGDDNTLSGSLGYLCKEIVVEMTDNDPQVVDYENIRLHNDQLRALDAELTEGTSAWIRYTDVYMKDYEWLMDTTGVTHPMDAQKVAYLKSVADELTAAADTDYEKVLRIYEYLADNFYYDNYAYNNDNEQQYCNPYDNLRCLRDGAEGPACSEGRVATVCNGYSAMVVALARAEGIPARIARGYHITGSMTVWSDKLPFTTVISHYWAETYVDGRWMVVDATRGSQNEWRRTGWDDVTDEAWVRGDVRTYVGFDIPDLALANNYFYLDYYSEYRELLPPVITEADTATGNVILRWDAVDGAEKYYVYRGDSDDAISYLCTVHTEQFIACSEQPGVPAYYRIRAVGGGAEGTYSNLQVIVLTEEECAQRTDGAITSQPQSVSAVPGDAVTFTVGAAGDYLSYRWQVCMPGSEEWTNSGAEGAGTDTIHVNATLARSGQRYRCVIKNGDYDKMISDEATLTVTQPGPVITAQPEDVTATVGMTATFTVSAGGTGLAYQWQYYTGSKWSNSGLTGNKTPTLSVKATAARNGQKYRCVITDANGNSCTSDPATLTVSPFITSQPADVYAPLRDTAVFHVGATGEDLIYRWQYNAGGSWQNASLSGHDTDTLSVPVASNRHLNKYRCVITDKNGGKVISNAATLYMTVSIAVQPRDISAPVGSVAEFSVGVYGTPRTYSWQYQAPGGSWRSSGLTGHDTAFLQVPVTVARHGYRYRCVVEDIYGVQVISRPAALTVQTSITSQPADVTAAIGDTARFTVSAAGAGLTYQWQYYTGSRWSNSGLSGNKTATLSVKATAARNGQKYRCVITDANGAKTYSSSAVLLIKTVITAQPADVTAAVGETARFTVEATGAGLTYQWQYYTSGGWKNSSLSGSKTATLSVKATAARNGQKYRCVITDANGKKTYSSYAKLTVL